MGKRRDPIVFAMDGATELAEGVEDWIAENWIEGFRLAPKEEWRRHDRESYALSKRNVRERKVYILQSFATDDVETALNTRTGRCFRVKVKDDADPAYIGTVGEARWLDEETLMVEQRRRNFSLSKQEVAARLNILGETVDEKIWGTIQFIRSLVEASCGSITLLGTMLPGMRQDEKDQPRAPINTATFARVMRAAGVRRLITMDVHSKSAMQNACSCANVRFDHLDSRCLLARQAVNGIPHNRRVVVLAADIGESKRKGPEFQDTVSRIIGRKVGFAVARKVRVGDTESHTLSLFDDDECPVGPRPGHGPDDAAYVLCSDDILATGGTLRDAKVSVESRGGIFYAACYTHNIFTGNAKENLRGMRLVGTKTVDPWRVRDTPIYDQIEFVDVSSVFARAIKETHTAGSINDLLQDLEPA